MSRLRKQVQDLFISKGWALEQDRIHPATGFYRTSHLADCYRWECFAVAPGYSTRTWLGCYQTMTEFVRLAKHYGFFIENGEVCALDQSAD